MPTRRTRNNTVPKNAKKDRSRKPKQSARPAQAKKQKISTESTPPTDDVPYKQHPFFSYVDAPKELLKSIDQFLTQKGKGPLQLLVRYMPRDPMVDGSTGKLVPLQEHTGQQLQLLVDNNCAIWVH